MNVWLCPVKPKSWRTIKTAKIFGAPRHASKIMRQVKSDDLLVFHVFTPINGITAVCKVTSQVYEDFKDIWGKDRYPLRVRIEFLPNFQRDENNPIPISSIFGKPSKKEVRVEPYLKNIWITKVTQEQYQILKDLFEKTTPRKNYRKSKSSSASHVSSQSEHISTAST